jgi:hypothetical protein
MQRSDIFTVMPRQQLFTDHDNINSLNVDCELVPKNQTGIQQRLQGVQLQLPMRDQASLNPLRSSPTKIYGCTSADDSNASDPNAHIVQKEELNADSVS